MQNMFDLSTEYTDILRSKGLSRSEIFKAIQRLDVDAVFADLQSTERGRELLSKVSLDYEQGRTRLGINYSKYSPKGKGDPLDGIDIDDINKFAQQVSDDMFKLTKVRISAEDLIKRNIVQFKRPGINRNLMRRAILKALRRPR